MGLEASTGTSVRTSEEFDHHGGSRPRGIDTVPRSVSHTGRFGRMFRTLPALVSSDASLSALAASMGEAPAGAAGDNPDLPSGYTYLGQFVDHDISFDPVSSHDRLRDPDGLHNVRTPRFDLDSVYGAGRSDSPFLYDEEDPAKLLVGRNSSNIHEPVDLPRNHQGRALIGDPRNDVHVVVSQLHLAFIRFHNAIVDHLRTRFVPDEELLAEARRLTCWHYQWVVIDDYLRRLVGPQIVDSVFVRHPRTGTASAHLEFFSWRSAPFMPVEFSGAAYRFGHSQVRDAYRINDEVEPLPILTDIRVPNPLQHLGGFRPLPKKWTVQWKHFFPLGTSPPQPSRRIDTRLAGPMRKLPQNIDHDRRSLALLNLLRGKALALPSGQSVATAMGTSVPNSKLGLSGESPLWYYLLREAETLEEGVRLGPTGGRVVAEVLVGLLKGDPTSFLRAAARWRPELPSAQEGRFTMVDLLRFAGVA